MADYAKHCGMALSTIKKHVKAGIIDLVDGQIDPVLADKQQAERKKKPIGRPSTGAAKSGEVTLYSARVEKLNYEAKLARLKYEEEISMLVNVKDIQRELFNKIRAIRDAVLNITPRVGAVVAAELGHPDKAYLVNRVMEKEVNLILTQLAEISGENTKNGAISKS